MRSFAAGPLNWCDGHGAGRSAKKGTRWPLPPRRRLRPGCSTGSCRSIPPGCRPRSSPGAPSPRSPSPRSWATRRSRACRSSPACTRSSCRCRVRPVRLVAPPRRRGGLGLGRDHGDRSPRDGPRGRTPQYVETASLSALMCAVLLVARPAPQARVHRQLPVTERPDRVPDRRRHPGRDGPVRRVVRGQRGQRDHPREVRQRTAGDPDRDERADAGRVGRRPGR